MDDVDDVGDRDVLALLARLEGGMHVAAGTGREVEELPGFRLYLAPTSDAPMLNLAIPIAGTTVDPGAALGAVRAAFARWGRRPRIELFAELHPDLEAAAAEAGFRRDAEAPVMVLPKGRRTASPAAAGTFRAFDPDDTAHLEAAQRAAHRAFGGEDDTGALEWLPLLVSGLRRGSIVGGTVDVGGVPVAGATAIIAGDVGELVGVWTAPAWRRRGFARQACAATLDAFFARGPDVAWLSAAEDAARLYASLGFERLGTQIDLSADREDRPR